MASASVMNPFARGGAFFECPRWHDGRWWLVDFYRHRVLTFDAAGRESTVLEVEAQPSGLGWLPGGDLLVVSMKDRRILRRATDGSVSVHADLQDLGEGHLNDMTVDRAGRAWVGEFGFDLMGGATPAPAHVYRVDPDGSAAVAADGLWFPNTPMVTDDDTLIVAETFGARFTAFAIADDGTLGDRRVWAQVHPTPAPGDTASMLAALSFAPDGCALDAENHVWAANAAGGTLARVAPGGEIVAEIAMPDGLGVFACGLGGPDRRTLLACAAPDFYETARSAAREAVLLSTSVAVPGAGRP
jgi:sugar lactone lactonase YvrE